jgi:hypothetical protein
MTASPADFPMPVGLASKPEDEKAHKKPPPQIIAILIFVFVTVYFALIAVPFLAASNNPDRNMGRFNVLIADFDGGFLGKSVVTFYESRWHKYRIADVHSGDRCHKYR